VAAMTPAQDHSSDKFAIFPRDIFT